MSGPREPHAPCLLVVSGPSGVGKTTVCNHLLARAGFERVVTATTRRPRPGERHGVDYVFLSDDEFDAWVADGRFLEWAHVHDRRYGSPRAGAEAILARGRHALLNIDVQGAASLRSAGLPVLTVFLLPPDEAELERRLRGRGSEPEAAVRRRLATARAELERAGEFDLRVVNDDARVAADAIARFLGAA